MEDSKKVPSWLRWLALATTFLTAFLILLGGVVHGTGSSLACPDWPTCHGSFFPEMAGGVLIEHSHRVVAASVGFLVIILCLGFWRSPFRSLLKYSLVALGLVIFQGVLGGVTVLFQLPPEVSTAHLGTSMIFLALLVYITRRAFVDPEGAYVRGEQPYPFFSLGILILLFCQILLGASVRHWGAGLACVEIPFCGGIWPANGPFLVKLQMAHRLLGLSVGIGIILHALWIRRSRPRDSSLNRWAVLSIFLVLAQIALGYYSVMTALELLPVTSHLGLAAILWITLWVIFLQMKGSSEHAPTLATKPGISKPPTPAEA